MTLYYKKLILITLHIIKVLSIKYLIVWPPALACIHSLCYTLNLSVCLISIAECHNCTISGYIAQTPAPGCHLYNYCIPRLLVIRVLCQGPDLSCRLRSLCFCYLGLTQFFCASEGYWELLDDVMGFWFRSCILLDRGLYLISSGFCHFIGMF